MMPVKPAATRKAPLPVTNAPQRVSSQNSRARDSVKFPTTLSHAQSDDSISIDTILRTENRRDRKARGADKTGVLSSPLRRTVSARSSGSGKNVGREGRNGPPSLVRFYDVQGTSAAALFPAIWPNEINSLMSPPPVGYSNPIIEPHSPLL